MTNLRGWATAITAVGALAIPAIARADQPWYSYRHHDLHEPWSIAPMVGLRGGGGVDGPVTSLEASLRVRHGDPPDNRDGAPDPRLVAFGLAVASTNLSTVEPAGFVGLHLLPGRRTIWSQRLYLNLRADVGAGYRFGELASAPLGYTRLAVGVLFARTATYVGGDGERRYTYGKDAFRGEVDAVVEVRSTIDGDWQVVAGIELDPWHIASNTARLITP